MSALLAQLKLAPAATYLFAGTAVVDMISEVLTGAMTLRAAQVLDLSTDHAAAAARETRAATVAAAAGGASGAAAHEADGGAGLPGAGAE